MSRKKNTITRRELIVGGITFAGTAVLAGGSIFEVNAEELQALEGATTMPNFEVTIYLNNGGMAKIMHTAPDKESVVRGIEKELAEPDKGFKLSSKTMTLAFRSNVIVGYSVVGV